MRRVGGEWEGKGRERKGRPRAKGRRRRNKKEKKDPRDMGRGFDIESLEISPRVFFGGEGGVATSKFVVIDPRLRTI